jgi:hypothetical protein
MEEVKDAKQTNITVEEQLRTAREECLSFKTSNEEL